MNDEINTEYQYSAFAEFCYIMLTISILKEIK